MAAPARPQSLLSLEAAAAALGIHRRTVRRWIADGTLTGYRLGPKFLRVDAAEVDALARRIPTAGSSPAA